VDQTILELFSRLTAIEHMLMHLQKVAYLNAKMTPDAIDRIVEASIEGFKTTAYPGFLDPVESDQFAAAVEERISSLLHGAKAMAALDLERKS
jgi:hypothetical protein